jgi:DNA-binding transcriptional ArsR family regulator
MVNYSPLDATFSALADPTRRAILARLAQGEATVSELAEPFDVSLPAVSKHLRVLQSAGLLQREIDGRIHRCRLAAQPMKDAAAWIETYRVFWEAQLESLARYLESAHPSADSAGSATAQLSATEPSGHKSASTKSMNEERPEWPRHKTSSTSPSKSAARSPRRAKKSSPRGPTPHN